MKVDRLVLLCCAALALVSCAPRTDAGPAGGPVAGETATRTPAPPLASASPQSATPTAVTLPASPVAAATATGSAPPADPFDLIAPESLFAYLEDLTAIQPYSGWRNSASQGEREAMDYVADRLAGFGYLAGLGLEVERESFHVMIGNELRDSRLYLSAGGREIEVPASALRGDRDDVALALGFDSDGRLNDAEADPVTVQGLTAVVRSEDEIAARGGEIKGRVVFLDYAVIDRAIVDPQEGVAVAAGLLDGEPAGVVLVTQFSDRAGESHGFAVGDLSAFNRVPQGDTRVPILYARLEDLAAAGIADWDELGRVESARLVWDADVSSPATSGNLIARVPGVDPGRALILGAHIDSPNSPGAMDDGSGSVILLETARVLDAARFQPPVDLYLVWFGSEELGLYGSSHFVSAHQELLDRTAAMLEIDDLTRPVEGIYAELYLVGKPNTALGGERLPWPEYLAAAAGRRGVAVRTSAAYEPWSDNSPFDGYDVPNADLIYMDEAAMEAAGGFHNAAQIHSPYDTVELAREAGDVLEQMARVALAAVVDAGRALPALRLSPPPDRRALIVASHTEPVHVSPAAMTDVAMALSGEGFDVDLIPYGRPVAAADLDGADILIVLPAMDYPAAGADAPAYDEAWGGAEIAALEGYAAGGGLLVVTNSAYRLKYANRVLEANEDWSDANALVAPFGVEFQEGLLVGGVARVEADHALTRGVRSLPLAAGNAVPCTVGAESAVVLATVDGAPAAVLIAYGTGGEVLVLADAGILGAAGAPARDSLIFWRNLAGYARGRD